MTYTQCAPKQILVTHTHNIQFGVNMSLYTYQIEHLSNTRSSRMREKYLIDVYELIWHFLFRIHSIILKSGRIFHLLSLRCSLSLTLSIPLVCVFRVYVSDHENDWNSEKNK